MAYISASTPADKMDSSYGIKNICRIIGLVCIIGFFFDMLVLGLPPQRNIEWRIGFVQELANRSIILLFGLGLFIFGSAGRSKSRIKFVSQLSMALGVVFFLLCLLSVVDSTRLSKQSSTAIAAQESQLRSQIQEARSNPAELPENIDLAALDQVSAQLTQQADQLRNNAQRTVLKTGISNIGNLLIVGAGLVGLGRTGMGVSRFRG